MKNSQFIIEHLKSSPHYSKLNNQTIFSALKKMLPKRFGESILFLHRKEDTLFIALSHPGMLMELNYNLTLIKELLKKASEVYPQLSGISNIKGYVKYQKSLEPTVSTEPRYHERSQGSFENGAQNEKIDKAIEAIRKVILGG